MTPNVDAQMQDKSPEASRVQLMEDLLEAHGILLRALKNISVCEETRFRDYARKAIKAASYVYPAPK